MEKLEEKSEGETIVHSFSAVENKVSVPQIAIVAGAFKKKELFNEGVKINLWAEDGEVFDVTNNNINKI